MKVKVMYFVTEKLVKFKSISIDERTGTARMGKDKEFQFDDTRPLAMESGLLKKSIVPFYVLKHDVYKPLDVRFSIDSGKTVADMVVTPENFKNMMTQGTLNTLLTLSTTHTSQMILFIAIGAVIGFLLGNVIPIGSFGG